MCSFADPVKLRLLQDQKKKILPRRTNLKNLKSPGVNIEIPFSGSQFESQHLPLAPAPSIRINYVLPELVGKIGQNSHMARRSQLVWQPVKSNFCGKYLYRTGSNKRLSVFFAKLKFELSSWLKMKQPIRILRKCFKDALKNAY